MKNTRHPQIILTNAAGLADFNGTALLVLSISKDEITSGNVASALERLYVIAETRETALRYRESLVFQVVGYETDPRELSEIPEVRAFFARLTYEWPHWLWFLQRNTGAIPLLLSLLCTIKVHHNPNSFGTEFQHRDELAQKMMDMFERGNAMFYAFGITPAEARESANTAVADLLGT